MATNLKTALSWIGTGLAVLGVVYVVLELFSFSAEIDLSRFKPRHWILALGLATIYGFSSFALGVAWWKLLLRYRPSVPLIWAIRTHGLSQLAKYVPGNIFHLAGRQALGVAAGLPGVALTRSAVWEVTLLGIAGAIFSPLILPSLSPVVSASYSLGMYAGSAALGIWCFARFAALEVAQAFVWQILFLIAAGVVFVCVLALVTESWFTAALLPMVCGAYVIAWLVGFITPGAPGGIGIREMVLLFLLEGHVATGGLLLALIVGRSITIVGDLVYFCTAAILSDQD